MADYTLPDLPYDFAALEPHYSGEILELHHDKHHAAYVASANTTLEKLADARDKDDFGAIVGLEKTLAFNVSGHVLEEPLARRRRQADRRSCKCSRRKLRFV
jgi:Fe-Mn family superoxide dismutase